MLKGVLFPQTARHARLLRLADRLAREKVAGAPTNEADKVVWVNSHLRKCEDERLSQEEESLREQKMPLSVGEHSFVNHGQLQGNLYHFRDYPMFPGEYVPAQHNTLSSLRDELRLDITSQSIKEAWMKVSGGAFFPSAQEFYHNMEGLDADQLGEIVGALFPQLDAHESHALVTKVLESISKPETSFARSLAQTITAEAVGLDDAPHHYTNFLEWMGRITETKAFRTEQAIFQFCRRKFNRRDVKEMYENYNLLSRNAIEADRADGYSHFYAVLKDYAVKIAAKDTRHQIGVRIDPPEVDLKTGFAFGYGACDYARVVAILRENRDGNGAMLANGKPLSDVFGNSSWLMERVLMSMDEAGLHYHDFDVYFVNEGKANPFLGDARFAQACQMALASAITKLMPLTRVPLKKAGVLSLDRRRKLGEHPGFLNQRAKRRPFRKR